MYCVFSSAGGEGSDLRDFLEDSCLGITPPAPSIPTTQILYSFSHKHRRKNGNFPFPGMRPFSPSPQLSLSFRSTATGSLHILFAHLLEAPPSPPARLSLSPKTSSPRPPRPHFTSLQLKLRRTEENFTVHLVYFHL